MTISEIQLYEILASKLGKEEAKSLVEFVESRAEKKLEEKTAVFATKDDIANLKIEIANAKVDLVRWVVGTGIALAGLIIAVVKFL
jgi:hypothetical protein